MDRGHRGGLHSLPSLSSQVNNNNGAFLPASAPSNQAAVLAEPLIGSANHSQVPIVAATSCAGLSAPPTGAPSTALVDRLHRVPTVLSAALPATSPDGRAAELLVVSSVSPLRPGKGSRPWSTTSPRPSPRSGLPADLQVHLAGQVATNVASQKQSAKQGNELQDGSLLFIIVLLLIIFRSVLAPIVTLATGGARARPVGLVHRRPGQRRGLKVSFFTQILLIVLVLGAGTDYGLFLVFRVREQLLAGSEPQEAVAYAVRRVGESITASAATVIVALLTLLAASFGLYHDLGLPLAIGIARHAAGRPDAAAGAAGHLGPGGVLADQDPDPDRADRRTWGRVAARLVRRPVWTLTIGLLALGGLSLFALGFKPTGFGGDVAAPAGSSAAKGNAALTAFFPQSSANPTNVVMPFPTSVWKNPGQLATADDGLRAGPLLRPSPAPSTPTATR